MKGGNEWIEEARERDYRKRGEEEEAKKGKRRKEVGGNSSNSCLSLWRCASEL